MGDDTRIELKISFYRLLNHEVMMSKKKAHVLLLLLDIFSIIGLWMGYNLINQVVVDITHSAETVEFNNRIGFLCFGVALPIIHLFVIYGYFWPKVIKKNSMLFNWSIFILLIILFASAFFISFRVRTYVERAGYLRCPQADHQLSFSTGLVYTKDAAICSRLIEEKRKPLRY
jgi:hypothetical protein